MAENDKIKRLFFGVEACAPWPQKLPRGRSRGKLLDENQRHFTLAFLGNVEFQPLLNLLTPPYAQEEASPFRPFLLKCGSAGYFDACLLLPPRHPRVVAWHAKWREGEPLILFQKMLAEWLKHRQYPLDEREWLPHLTLCRHPGNPDLWMKMFSPLPFFTQSIHLYESMGNLTYQPLWSYPLPAPFEEIAHTADMAFWVYGDSVSAIYYNAFIALAFKHPLFLKYAPSTTSAENIDDVVIGLNEVVCQADRDAGSPLKAVSFHGELEQLANGLLKWEMIVDV